MSTSNKNQIAIVMNFIAPFLKTVFVLALLVLEAQVTFAQRGYVIVEPKRLVLENGVRSGSFTLLYTGGDTASYTVSLVDVRMREDGDLITLNDSTESDSLSAKTLIRFFPKEITLSSNEAQIIRVQIIRPEGLPVAEYRSHLAITPMEKPKPFEKLDDTAASVQTDIVLALGVVVPIIFRNGTTYTPPSLSDISVYYDSLNHTDMMRLRLHRTGNQSVYGSLLVKYYPNVGDPVLVGLIKGIGVYVPLEYRSVNLPLSLKDVDLNKGKLIVTLQSYTGDGNENELAQTEYK